MRMGNKSDHLILFFFFFFLLCIIIDVNGYKNYTVGDSLGWYDALENPKVDYRKWAAGKNFSLGDFLIFNTDTNHSVIQTYNLTMYTLCDYDNAVDNDTLQWSEANPSNTATTPVSVSVPLRRVGPIYFFSSDYDGEQCLNGQRLQINVTYGQGLPPSLRDDDDDDSPSPISPQSGDEESVPDTLVPSNFDNPKDTSDDDEPEASNSIRLSAFSKLFGVQLHGFFLVVGYFILSC